LDKINQRSAAAETKWYQFFNGAEDVTVKLILRTIPSPKLGERK
jgi:hypothetical protein